MELTELELRQMLLDARMREVLYKFLWDETHKEKIVDGKIIPACPMPNITGGDYIKEELQRLLGIRNRWF